MRRYRGEHTNSAGGLKTRRRNETVLGSAHMKMEASGLREEKLVLDAWSEMKRRERQVCVDEEDDTADEGVSVRVQKH